MSHLPNNLYYWQAIELPYALFKMYHYRVELADGTLINPETHTGSYSGKIVYLLNP